MKTEKPVKPLCPPKEISLILGTSSIMSKNFRLWLILKLQYKNWPSSTKVKMSGRGGGQVVSALLNDLSSNPADVDQRRDKNKQKEAGNWPF